MPPFQTLQSFVQIINPQKCNLEINLPKLATLAANAKRYYKVDIKLQLNSASPPFLEYPAEHKYQMTFVGFGPACNYLTKKLFDDSCLLILFSNCCFFLGKKLVKMNLIVAVVIVFFITQLQFVYITTQKQPTDGQKQ